MVRWSAVAAMGLAVGTAGCAHLVEPGLKMTRLPPGLAWCSDGPVRVPPRQAKEPPGGSILPPALFAPCMKALSPFCNDFSWVGSVVYGLNTDANGAISSVCVWGGNFGDAVEYVGCAATQMERSGYRFEPKARRLEYVLTYVCD